MYKDLIFNSRGYRKSNQLLRHPLSPLFLQETRTLYFLVQCSCQVFLAKNLMLISITAIRGGYEKTVCCVFSECECWTGSPLIGILFQ